MRRLTMKMNFRKCCLLKKTFPEEPFTSSAGITSLIITKLDGTAKGGVVIGISDQFRIPVRYIGIGEKMEDLQVFDRFAFVEALFASS